MGLQGARVKITTDTADELLERASKDLGRLTRALGGHWTFADGAPFELERFLAESTPQPVTVESDGALVTVGHQYLAVLVRPASGDGALSAEGVRDAVAGCGFSVTDSRREDSDRYDLWAVGDEDALLVVRGSAAETTVSYSSAGSSDPSLQAAVTARGRAGFQDRRRRDAARNPYLDGVYAERDAQRAAERGTA